MALRGAGSALIAGLLAVAAQAQPVPSQNAATAPVPRETRSNIETGIYPMRYVGDPAGAITRIQREAIMTRAILTQGDPMGAGSNGAVLRYRKEVVLGTLMPGEATPLAAMPEQQVVYIESGTGTLDDGQHIWPLREGLVVLLPGNIKNRIAATGDRPLQMLTMTESAHTDEKASRSILVRDLAKILYVEQGTHWTNMSKAPFTDVGERFLIVYMGPRTLAGPHAHTPETEEGWVKLTDGEVWMEIGSEILPWKRNMGMIAPPNGQTVHAAINTSNSVQAFFYFATNRAPGSPPLPVNPNRAPPNPIYEQSAIAATIAPGQLRSNAVQK
jgi:mannose-6-phosphate isomerase-like protein (cupin superfamily)